MADLVYEVHLDSDDVVSSLGYDPDRYELGDIVDEIPMPETDGYIRLVY